MHQKKRSKVIIHHTLQSTDLRKFIGVSKQIVNYNFKIQYFMPFSLP